MSKVRRTVYRLGDKPFNPSFMGLIIKKDHKSDVFDSSFEASVKKQIIDFYSQNIFDGIETVESSYGVGNRINLKGREISSNSTAFLFMTIDTEDEINILIVPRTGKYQKVWVNFEYYSYLKCFDIAYVVTLQKGENIIAFEISDACEDDYLFLRISKLATEINSEHAFMKDRLVYSGDFGYIQRTDNFLTGKDKSFSFMFFPNNDITSPKDQKAEVILSRMSFEKGKLKKELITTEYYFPRSKIEYDFSKYSVGEDPFSFFKIELFYTYSTGFVHDDTVNIFTYYPQKCIEEVYDNCLNRVRSRVGNEYDLLFLEDYITRIDKTINISAKTNITLDFLNEYSKLQEDGHFDDSLFHPGYKRVLYYSKTFEDIGSFYVYIPDNYDTDRTYPLLVMNTTVSLVNAEHFANYFKEDVIAIDVILRGVNLGCYIGEAAIWEAITEAKRLFSIDEDRVYMTGNSNGGGAALLQAQLYPDRFAGIYPFAAGGVNNNLIKNLYNVKVISVSSPTESRYWIFENLNRSLKDIGHPDYEGLLFDNYSHVTLTLNWMNSSLFKLLFSGRREKYPRKVYFKTTRNRSRKAYWLEIHSIDFGASEAAIEAEIKGNTISIKTENASGITVDLPPFIQRERFAVSLNDQVFTFEGYAANRIIFKKNKNTFTLTDDYDSIEDQHKGNGLLDVYLDPLFICVPDKESSYDFYRSIAKRFSSPRTNGYDPKLYVSYPIKTYKETVDSVFCKEKSIILIDDLSENDFLAPVRGKAVIKYDASGFDYMCNRSEGDYLIMQIVSNPWNHQRNILLISTNVPKFFNSNIFTRSVIIPTYVGGGHPFLNNDALIYDGKDYKIISEFGLEIKTT